MSFIRDLSLSPISISFLLEVSSVFIKLFIACTEYLLIYFSDFSWPVFFFELELLMDGCKVDVTNLSGTPEGSVSILSGVYGCGSCLSMLEKSSSDLGF